MRGPLGPPRRGAPNPITQRQWSCHWRTGRRREQGQDKLRERRGSLGPPRRGAPMQETRNGQGPQQREAQRQEQEQD